jgi:aminoglycoside 3-N-acetyltransferase
VAEVDAIKKSKNGPVTLTSLIKDIECIGVKPGMTLLVHSSLSAMGWVCGGPVAALRALETVLGSDGTLVMPTHSSDLSDPAEWENPPVNQSWWEIIKNTMPPYDADLTPTREMGAIPECFRKQMGVKRSCHPQVSFAAWGSCKENILEGHSLNNGLGEQSPLARIYDLGGSALLIGVGYESNTSLHLAEYRATFPGKVFKKCGAPISLNGNREWVTFDDLDTNEDDFSEIGKAYEESESEFLKGRVGYAESILIPQRELVNFAVEWMGNHRM